MIRYLYSALLRVLPRQLIPKLPRGMLSSDYAGLSHDEARVLARLGARDPRGIKIAMQRHNVTSVDELVKLLKHHEVDRQFRLRLNALICRVTHSTNYDPAVPQMRELGRELRERQDPYHIEMKRRLHSVIAQMEERQ